MSAEQKPFEEIQEPLQAPTFESVGDEGAPESYEEPAHQSDLAWIDTEGGEDEGSYAPRRRDRGGRDRSARRGTAPSALPEPETPETHAEEEVFLPKATTEPEEPATPAPRRIYNKDIPDGIEQRILGAIAPEATEPQTDNQNQDAIDRAIAEHAQRHNTDTDPIERPNISGPQKSFRVNLPTTPVSSRISPNAAPVQPAPEAVAPEAPKTPAEAEEPTATPEPVAASTSTSDEEIRITQPVAPATPTPRRTAQTSGGDLYTQLGLSENPLTTDRDTLRGASRTGLASTGVPPLSSREIRDGATPEPASTPGEATAEPSEPSAELPRRGRHRRETPASFADRVLGYTTARSAAETASDPDTTETSTDADNEATQQLPTITIGEATTGEAAPRLSRTQRLRAKLGSVAVAVRDFTKNERQNKELRQLGVMPPNSRPGIQPGMSKAERRLEERRQKIEANADSTTDQNFGIVDLHINSPEENAQRERGRGARRRRMVGALGLAAASVGLMAGVSGDMSREEAPRSSISANQLPSQQQERQESISSIFDDQIEKIQDGLDRQVENLEKGDKSSDTSDTSNEQVGKTIDVGNEKITLDNDGGVTIKLEKGGNYWEGVHEAERLLDIDDSATATANAVNTIGFEEGEDRSQKVGAKVTFKNVNGKLVASRS